MSSDDDSIFPVSKSRINGLRFLLVLASVLFLLGISLPMMTLTSLLVFSQSFSIIAGVLQLLSNGQIVLFILIVGFSILLPLMKLYILFRLLFQKRARGKTTRYYLHLMHEYGRWAMLDVMVVAVLIVTVKLGAVASVQVHSGLFVFGAAVLLIMLITHWVVGLTRL